MSEVPPVSLYSHALLGDRNLLDGGFRVQRKVKKKAFPVRHYVRKYPNPAKRAKAAAAAAAVDGKHTQCHCRFVSARAGNKLLLSDVSLV